MKLDQAAVHALNLFPSATDCMYHLNKPSMFDLFLTAIGMFTDGIDCG
jgi:hypothetical protein